LAWDHAFAATVDYQKDQGVESKSRYFASYSGHYKFAERYYAAGIASWERDRFSGFNSRTSEGLGVGYAVLQGPDMTLSVEAGPALRQTDYITGRSENMMAARVATDYRWNIRPNLALTETASFYGEGHDSTVVSETGLMANLIDALSARLSFHVQYETHPPLALENTDTATRLTLVYSF
jgi:putative salt-induced outer membrane protein